MTLSTGNATYKPGPRKSSADICRERGWAVGTRLLGNDGSNLQRVTITAVGTVLVLAADRHGERQIDLTYRTWRDEADETTVGVA